MTRRISERLLPENRPEDTKIVWCRLVKKSPIKSKVRDGLMLSPWLIAFRQPDLDCRHELRCYAYEFFWLSAIFVRINDAG